MLRKNSNRWTFTVPKLKALAPPIETDREYHRDESQTGLNIAVLRGGGKVFYYVGKCLGRTVRVKIGPFPATSIEDARRRCKEIAGDVSKGIDPMRAKRTARTEPTLKMLFSAWLETHAKAHKRERSWREDERVFNTLATSLHNRRLGNFDSAVIKDWHSKTGINHGNYAANRGLALLSSLFREAKHLFQWQGENPAKGVKRFAEVARERFLHPDELQKLFAVLEDAGEPWSDYFRLALFTGARRGNLTAMRWDEISFDDRIWTISGDKAKAGKPITIALSPQAIKILKARQAISGSGEWVFPSCGKTGHLVEIKTGWKAIVTATGLPDLRPHDLRRTLGSWQAAQGASETIIGKSLGHAPGSPATAVYARLDLDPVRRSVESATAAMAAAAKPKKRGAK